ncbi:MAG: hypothetical protein QM713_02435 [Arachnia sp.]
MTNSILVLGAERRGALIQEALRRIGVPSDILSPDRAHRSPGLTKGRFVLMLWPPGARPVLEAEHHAHGDGALHAWWDLDAAEVGPFVAPWTGPCPACLAAQAPGPRSGHDPALAAWVAATVALHVHGLLHHQTTELMGASVAWSTARPGTGAVLWPRRADCAVAGCIDGAN